MSPLLDKLIAAIRLEARFHPEEQVEPLAIVWTDKKREWEPLIPGLQSELPGLVVFDPAQYRPAEHRGPGAWIRCVIERTMPLDPPVPDGEPFVVYLPGVGRQDLRAGDDCPRELQLLAFLQYDGELFTHENGRDWTVRAFLNNESRGIGVEVASDQQTQDAMLRSLGELATRTVDELRAASPLKADYFDGLLNPDPVARLLRWISSPEGERAGLSDEQWESFRSLCRAQYGFDPQADGPLEASRMLGEHTSLDWKAAWQRFCEAPARYPGIPDRLRQSRPTGTAGTMVDPSGWPQDNEGVEEALRSALVEAAALPASEACKRILELEREHAGRRNWVWATLGQAPLAAAVEHLAATANRVEKQLSGTDTTEMVASYAGDGWKVDDAAMRSLGSVRAPADVSAVGRALRTIYEPWLETAARRFQERVGDGSPEKYRVERVAPVANGTCVVFVDGLRYDLGHRLGEMLEKRGFPVSVAPRLTALPTLTATGKPAAAPFEAPLRGGPEFEPTDEGGRPMNAVGIRAHLETEGVQILEDERLGDPTGRGWLECGNIDDVGHQRGVEFASRVDDELALIAQRILSLLSHGWQRVQVVTDHGFLLLPGRQPTVQQPIQATAKRKRRCARLKDLASTEMQTVPWTWDEGVLIAVPPGIAGFEGGSEYDHGGLSIQECVTPVVSIGGAAAGAGVSIASAQWRGMRCRVKLEGAEPGTIVDLRSAPRDPTASILNGGKAVDDEGNVSFLVADDGLEGSKAWLVVTSPSGELLTQEETTVGAS